MVTITTCDVCQNEPRAEGEDFAPNLAPWTASLKVQDGSIVSTVESIDVCKRHIGNAVTQLTLHSDVQGFHCIQVDRL